MKTSRLFKGLSAAVAAALFCGFGAGKAAELSVASPTTVANAVPLPYRAQIQKRSGIELYVEPLGSGKSVRALAEGRADIAAVSAPLVDVVVSKMPNAIGLSTGTSVDKGVIALRLDRVIEQPLFLITVGEPDTHLKKSIEAVRSITLGKKAGV